MKLEPYNQREIYIARYCKDAWNRAVELAGRHRARARDQYGLTEHWTAAEWLDLCATTDFVCSVCASKATLEPHHCTSMVFGGSNTIGNIAPICRDCHKPLYSDEANEHWERERPRLQREREQEQLREQEERAEAWFQHQQSLLVDFASGDAVCRRCDAHNIVPGVIVRVLPPERGESPKPLESLITPGGQREAMALVYWPMSGIAVFTPSRVTETVPLEGLVKADVAAWVARQQEMFQPEMVGETVRVLWGRKSARGVVLGVLPPSLGGSWDFGEDASASEIAARWQPWSGTVARVRWDNGKGRISYKSMSLERLITVNPHPL